MATFCTGVSVWPADATHHLLHMSGQPLSCPGHESATSCGNGAGPGGRRRRPNWRVTPRTFWPENGAGLTAISAFGTGRGAR